MARQRPKLCTEIIADEMRMLGGKGDAAAAGAGGGRSGGDEGESHAAPAEAYGSHQAGPSGPEISDEDIPF
jgi:single-stranded DNA-binding protein